MGLFDDEYWVADLILLLLIAGAFFILGGFAANGGGALNIHLSNNTSNKICQDLATYSGMNYSNETISGITAESKKGELICILPEEPSYDHTTLIKFQEVEK